MLDYSISDYRVLAVRWNGAMEKSLFTKQYRVFLERLRKARVEANLTQAQLARRLGETQSFISKVERGERRLDVVELRVFCRALRVPFPAFTHDLDHALSVGERRRSGRS
jgi:transcriptional regulator with XRE-family HTH domain